MPLYHLVYFSTCNNATETDLHAISVASARNNARDGITGCLLVDGTYFFQVVEGRRRLLSALLERLIRDPRHQELTIADFSGIDHRSFRAWNMRPLRLDTPGIDETFIRYTGHLPDPTELSGSQIWDMLESMAQIAEDEAARVRRVAVSK